MSAYIIVDPEEKAAHGMCENYDTLIGPNGFICVLGEPEDRTWYRDANDVVVELNRLNTAVETARAQGLLV